MACSYCWLVLWALPLPVITVCHQICWLFEACYFWKHSHWRCYMNLGFVSPTLFYDHYSSIFVQCNFIAIMLSLYLYMRGRRTGVWEFTVLLFFLVPAIFLFLFLFQSLMRPFKWRFVCIIEYLHFSRAGHRQRCAWFLDGNRADAVWRSPIVFFSFLFLFLLLQGFKYNLFINELVLFLSCFSFLLSHFPLCFFFLLHNFSFYRLFFLLHYFYLNFSHMVETAFFSCVHACVHARACMCACVCMCVHVYMRSHVYEDFSYHTLTHSCNREFLCYSAVCVSVLFIF